MRLGAIVLALPALLVTAAPAADYFAGSWKEDIAKSVNNWGEKFSSPRTRTYTPTSNGGYDVKIDSTDENGKTVSTTLQAGGNSEMALPSSRNKGVQMLGATHVISRRVDDHTLLATYRKNGKDVGTSTSKISPDGRTLTMTLDGTSANGKPVKAVAVYRK